MQRTLPATWALPRIRLTVELLAWPALLALAIPLAAGLPLGDAHIYHSLYLPDLYGGYHLAGTGYAYSPAFALFTEPLRWLPFAAFALIVTAANLTALAYLVSAPVALILVVMHAPVVFDELSWGNLDLVTGALIVVAFSRPAAWAFPLLTKVTPGVGVLWHAARAEWRAVAIAASVTLGIVAASAVVMPDASLAWIGLLLSPQNRAIADDIIPIPFTVRLAFSAVMVVYAARTDRPWLVPLACVIGLPDPNLAHWTIALGSIRLLRRSHSHESSSHRSTS